MHGTEHCQIPDGEISIKFPELKNSYALASEMESHLVKLQGVAYVRVNPLNGYVLVLFDSQVISHYQVFGAINDFNCFLLPHQTIVDN